MSFEILAAYANLDAYISEMERPNADAQALWEKYAVEPFWPKLSQYAPMDISERKPKPVSDLALLKKQVEMMRRLDLKELKADFDKAAAALGGYDDTMYIALYPIENDWVRKAQNGVLGTCTWGHMVLCVDPLADDYEKWMRYVFAHEYHHNIWGHHWYHLHGGELGNIFINDMLSDGLADSFALSLYPELKPSWLYDITHETEKRLWNEHYAQLVEETGVDYRKYMFGDDLDGIPWCAGYALGFRIVQQYIKTHPQSTMKALLEMRPIDIYNESRYRTLMFH